MTAGAHVDAVEADARARAAAIVYGSGISAGVSAGARERFEDPRQDVPIRGELADDAGEIAAEHGRFSAQYTNSSVLPGRLPRPHEPEHQPHRQQRADQHLRAFDDDPATQQLHAGASPFDQQLFVPLSERALGGVRSRRR